MEQDTACEKTNRYVDIIREMIRHEDQVLNQRMTWMWTLQGLLYGAVGFLWQSGKLFPIIVIAFVGLLSCITIGYSLVRGMAAVSDLLELAKQQKERVKERCVIPPTIGSRSKAIEWLLPGYSLPWIMGGAWCALIAIRLA